MLDHVLNCDLLRDVMRYVPETGAWYRKKRAAYNSIFDPNKRVDTVNVKLGYREVVVLGRKYYAHRLAWFYMTGHWPTRIDHANTDRQDNTWVNLRECTSSQNNINRKKLLGVSRARDCATEKWIARITVLGKSIPLGRFSTQAEAIAARKQAERFYFGEFSRNA